MATNIKIAKKQFVIDELAKKVDLPTEPVAGQGVNVPYYFSVDYGTDKATVKDYTINLLDKSQAPQTFSLDINSATTTTAGLMTSADKTKLDSLTPGTGGDMVTITANNTFSGKAKETGTFTDEELELVKKDTTTIKVIDNKADLGAYVIAVNKLVGNVDESGTKAYIYEGVYMSENGTFVNISVEVDHEGNWTVRQHNIIGAYQYLDDEHETSLYTGGIALDATYGWYNLTGTLEDNFKNGETLRGDFNYDGTSGVTFDDQAYTGNITVGTRSFTDVDILNMTEGFYLAYLPDDAGDVQLRLVNNGTHTIDEALATLNSVKLTEEYVISPMDAHCVNVDGTTIINTSGVLEAVKQEQEEFNTLIFDGELQAQTDSQVDFSAAQSVELGGVAEVSAAPTTDNGVANKGYVDSAVSGKVDNPKEPVSGQGVNVPYYFSVAYNADNAVVTDYTIDLLDNTKAPATYDLTINSATETTAGLMSADDKVKLDGIDLSSYVTTSTLSTNYYDKTHLDTNFQSILSTTNKLATNKIDFTTAQQNALDSGITSTLVSNIPTSTEKSTWNGKADAFTVDGTTITMSTARQLSANIPSSVTFKGVATAVPTTGMVTGDMWWIGSAQPYNINVYNGTAWIEAGVTSIDISSKADANNPALTGSGTFVSLQGSGTLALDSTGSADFSKATSVALPDSNITALGGTLATEDLVFTLSDGTEETVTVIKKVSA